MSDYISRQAAIDVASHECYELRGVFERIEKGLKELPSTQPELIRCKDCRQWYNSHLCRQWSKFGTIETDADDFCSYGERNEQIH